MVVMDEILGGFMVIIEITAEDQIKYASIPMLRNALNAKCKGAPVCIETNTIIDRIDQTEASAIKNPFKVGFIEAHKLFPQTWTRYPRVEVFEAARKYGYEDLTPRQVGILRLKLDNQDPKKRVRVLMQSVRGKFPGLGTKYLLDLVRYDGGPNTISADFDYQPCLFEPCDYLAVKLPASHS